MKSKTIYVFTFIFLFNNIFNKIVENNNYTFDEDVEYESFTFDEAVNYINDVSFTKNDYDDMISNLITLLNNKYVYLDIAKNPPHPYKPVDVIQELKSINTTNIKYYDFYQQVFTILIKLQDLHLDIFFKKIFELEYLSPIYYYTITINDKNYLFCGLIDIAFKYFDKEILDQIIQKCTGRPIFRINGKDPFDYVQTFGRNQILKSEHAQFTFNINQHVYNGKFNTYPFIKNDLEHILIQFDHINVLVFDYKILKPKNMSRQFEEFYKEEMKKYSPNDIIKPTIIEIEQKFLEKNNKTRKLQQSIWDKNYKDKIKFKVDDKNNVNVIYQNSFAFFVIENGTIIVDENYTKFFFLIYEEIKRNKFPIVIIEDFNGGGLLNSVFYLLNTINPELALNSLNSAIRISDNYTPYEIDDYGNGIKHKRSKIKNDYYNWVYNLFKKMGTNIRKPTEIIVFTDGFSYSATSTFIKNLQESGNAIIVGYNGNPSEKKKNEKFDSSHILLIQLMKEVIFMIDIMIIDMMNL